MIFHVSFGDASITLINQASPSRLRNYTLGGILFEGRPPKAVAIMGSQTSGPFSFTL
jgi:hypothetical protein